MTSFNSHHDVAQHMREPVEPPEWFDHQVQAYQDKVLPWLQSISANHGDREDIRRMIIDKMRDVCGIEVRIENWTTDGGGSGREEDPDTPVAYDIIPVRNLESYDPERQSHEVVNNLLDIPDDRGKGVIKTDKGLAEALASGDIEARKLWTPGGGHSH